MITCKAVRIPGVPLISPLQKMTGGVKAKWLKDHRDMVLECLDLFGDYWTCHLFCMKLETLQALADSPAPVIKNDSRLDPILLLKLRISALEKENSRLRKGVIGTTLPEVDNEVFSDTCLDADLSIDSLIRQARGYQVCEAKAN